MAGRRSDRQRPAFGRAAKPVVAADLWHTARFPAATPSIATQAGRAGNRRHTGTDRHDRRRDPGAGYRGAPFPAACDVIFVDDPAWFLMFGSFAAMGAKVVGIPRLADGPDIVKLAELAAVHKPRLYVINSVLHNPTSTSLSAAKAFQILRIAEEHDFTIVEDDIYCDMHPGAGVQAATRMAALDQLHRVIYLGGFSKSLSANLRVGFIATSPELARHLADRKMLSTLTTSEIGERVIYKILSEGHYRKHTERLRNRLNSVRDKVVRQLEKVGLDPGIATSSGMFVWADAGRDTNVLTEKAMAQGFLLAPGSLFSPNQLPSTKMRINVASMADPGIWRFFEQELG